LLCTESIRPGRSAPRWKFVLQSVDGNERLSAADSEFESRRSRLELLAVVRGLEAIDRPSRVTLLTRSRYVSQGIRRQLNQWREYHWQWERFGKLVPIRDQDLWQRVDRALEFHTVDCCSWHVEDHATKLHFAARPACWQSRNGLASSIPAAFVAAVLAILRRGVLTPFSAIWRPTFTQAA
jgi:ribonuclease HI